MWTTKWNALWFKLCILDRLLNLSKLWFSNLNYQGQDLTHRCYEQQMKLCFIQVRIYSRFSFQEIFIECFLYASLSVMPRRYKCNTNGFNPHEDYNSLEKTKQVDKWLLRFTVMATRVNAKSV